MPGVTHWHSPQFHAYFPTANSYPGIVADILSDAIGCIGFSWIASPACTELEMVGIFFFLHKTGLEFAKFRAESLSYPIFSTSVFWGGRKHTKSIRYLPQVTMNWLGKMLELPDDFLFGPGSKGGGVIQGTASEATLVALLSARSRAITRYLLPY